MLMIHTLEIQPPLHCEHQHEKASPTFFGRAEISLPGVIEKIGERVARKPILPATLVRDGVCALYCTDRPAARARRAARSAEL